MRSLSLGTIGENSYLNEDLINVVHKVLHLELIFINSTPVHPVIIERKQLMNELLIMIFLRKIITAWN